MGTIVNLRQHRKRKARLDKAKDAAQNRLTFGRTKAEKRATEMERSAENAVHEGHRLRNNPDAEAEPDATKPPPTPTATD